MNKQVNKYINNYCKCISRTKENNSIKENVSISPSKLLIEEFSSHPFTLNLQLNISQIILIKAFSFLIFLTGEHCNLVI